MKVNINDTVKVKLTPIGIKILKEEEERLEKLGCTKYNRFPINEEGYCIFQLYEIFEYFGKYFKFGLNVKDSPIEFDFEIMES